MHKPTLKGLVKFFNILQQYTVTTPFHIDLVVHHITYEQTIKLSELNILPDMK